MSDPETEDRFDLARRIAKDAAAHALHLWERRDALTIETKASRQDIVSEADRAVETAIRQAVTAAFPGDGFLGEELGQTPAPSGFTWVIDPIDGTSPYLHGIPSWCVSIAVVREARTIIGMIAAPTHGELYAVRLGAPATLNGRPLRLGAELTIRNAATGIGASHRTDPEWVASVTSGLMRQGGMFFRNGSGALMLAYVAAGRLAGYLEPHMHAWDCLAGLLLVGEAGGRTAPFAPGGDLTAGGRVIAAAPGAWDDLARLMGDSTAPAALA